MHLTMRRPAVLAAAALTGLGVAVIPAGPALASPGCGAVLTANTTVTSDLSCAGNAYTVAASGITVNLAGHTITGSGTGTGITIGSGLPPGVHDVTITNGTVAGFARQIDIESGHDFTLRKLQLSGPGEAVFEANNTTTTLTSTTVRHGTARFQNAKNVTVDRSVFVDSPLSFVNSSNTPHVTNSTLTDSPVNIQEANDALISHDVLVRSPVSAHNSSFRPVVRASTFTGAGVAVEFDDAVLASRVTGNMFVGNGVGLWIRAFGSTNTIAGTVVSGNTFAGNGAAGLLLEADPGSAGTGTVTVKANSATANGYLPAGRVDLSGNPVADGLHILAAQGDDIRVGTNTTTGNAGYGIFAEPGTVVDLGGNTSIANPLGCLGVTC